MKIYDNYSLLTHNTFGINVITDKFIEYSTVDELQDILGRDIVGNRPFLHIGKGSNLLFLSDFKGIVFHSAIKFIEYHEEDDDIVSARVGAGVVWDDFCEDVARHGLWGSENLSHIPGEVGAAAVQNIGAYGVEAADIITEVETIERATGNSRKFSCTECKYGYRESIFKSDLKDRYIVTAVKFRLSKTATPRLNYAGLRDLGGLENLTPMKIRETVTAIRKQKLPEPEEFGSAGSFFKNPVVGKEQFDGLKGQHPDMPYYPAGEEYKIPAAWLIDQCGFKGKILGGAQIYPQQPLVIINLNNATAGEIASLAEETAEAVRQRFGIQIYPEVNYIYGE